MTTLGALTERIMRLYKPEMSDDADLEQREVELLVIDSLNALLKMTRMKENMYESDFMPPHALIATYENIPVVEYTAQTTYSTLTLPAYPISLPRDMGIWRIYQKGNVFQQFIPVQSGMLEFYIKNKTTSIEQLLGSGDLIAYELLDRDTVIFYADNQKVGGVAGTVNVQLLIVDPSNMTEYDNLPAPADMQESIVIRVMEILRGRNPQRDVVNDDNDQA